MFDGPVTQKQVVILNTLNIFRDQTILMGIGPAAVADLLKAGIVLDGDYYDFKDKDKWMEGVKKLSDQRA